MRDDSAFPGSPPHYVNDGCASHHWPPSLDVEQAIRRLGAVIMGVPTSADVRFDARDRQAFKILCHEARNMQEARRKENEKHDA